MDTIKKLTEEIKELKEELEACKRMNRFLREKGVGGRNQYFNPKTREWGTYINDLEVSTDQYNIYYKNVKRSRVGYSYMYHRLGDGATQMRKVEMREDLGLRCESIDGKSWHRIEVRQEE
jgi:hypothetical protein